MGDMIGSMATWFGSGSTAVASTAPTVGATSGAVAGSAAASTGGLLSSSGSFLTAASNIMSAGATLYSAFGGGGGGLKNVPGTPQYVAAAEEDALKQAKEKRQRLSKLGRVSTFHTSFGGLLDKATTNKAMLLGR